MLSAPGKQGSDTKKMIESCVSSPFMKSLLSGLLSGTCSTLLFQPFDLVKTRIQSPIALGQRSTGLVAVVVNVMRNETVLGFWKGITPSLCRTVPGIGLYFGSLHYLQTNFGTADPSAMESVRMGAAARFVSGAILMPVTVIKTRIESGFFEYRGIKHAFQSICQREGAKGLYSGLSATLWRDVPFSGLYLMFYTQGKKYVRQHEGWESPNPKVNFCCGILAGGLAATITQPFDVIKTHMQLYPDKFSSVKIVRLHVCEKDGLGGFLRGAVPRILRRSLMAAASWTVYEEVMKRMGLK